MSRKASVPAVPPPAWTFPEFVLCQASAGSGKTHALSLRFVRLLLAENVPAAVQRDLVNILAITFTRNAAREMKERILGWLKDAVFEDPAKTRELLAAVGGTPESLRLRAGQAIDRILGGYTDFQVATIDSFMATVFRASAVDLGYPPDFEIVLEPSEAVDYAFSLYLRRVAAGTREGAEFERILDYLLDIEKGESAFAWDPAAKARARLGEFYLKLSGRMGELVVEDFGRERAKLGALITDEARRIKEVVGEVVERLGLERAPRGHAFTKIFPAAEAGRIADLLDFSFKTMPVKKASAKGDTAALEACEAIASDWKRLEKLVLKFGGFYARDFFSPYIRVYRALDETLDKAKRSLGTVFLEDVHRELASYLDTDVVPDVYFRLGDRVAHFLIDEFQDTSPVQWRNFRPLIEESLSRGGSLFLVGDTKQAIYGFRDADFRIMKGLADEAGGGDGECRAFGPVAVRKETLPENYRSHRAVLDFVKRVFLSEPSRSSGEEERGEPSPDDFYASWKQLSGLDDFEQDVCGKNKDRPGYVRSIILHKDGGTGAGGESGAATDSGESLAGNSGPAAGSESGSAGPDAEPEKKAIQDAVRDLVGRGWTHGDIAVLTYRNEDVVRVSSWLNEIGAPFIPFSSLDVRKRRIIAEVLALLRFLDSPPDDLSFAAFLGGDLFAARLRRDGGPLDPIGIGRFLFANREADCRPLYTAFRKEYPALWDRYFEPLFRAVGYYPLYDLTTLLFRTFDVFALFPPPGSAGTGGNPEGCAEEGALVKLLEAVKNFEGEGRNDLREFVELAGDDETGAKAWNIDVPADLDAVRVMSIHKAKGLGFPVVILLLYGQRWQPPPFFVLEDEARVRLVKLNERLSDADEQLAEAYKDRKDRDWVNALNTLYVALTRARAELHIIGVRGARDRYPFDLLGEPAASAPEPPPVVREAPPTEGPGVKRARFRPAFEPKPDPRDVLTTAHIRRGEAVHALLAEIEFVRGDWASEARAAVARVNPAEPDRPLFEAAGEVVTRYFVGAPLAAFFESRPGRSIRNEFEVCDAAGRIFRMDRVIVDEDGITILDYKTGPQPFAGRETGAASVDRAQIREYARLLRDVFPGRPIRGVLVYIDHPGTSEEAL